MQIHVPSTNSAQDSGQLGVILRRQLLPPPPRCYSVRTSQGGPMDWGSQSLNL